MDEEMPIPTVVSTLKKNNLCADEYVDEFHSMNKITSNDNRYLLD